MRCLVLTMAFVLGLAVPVPAEEVYVVYGGFVTGNEYRSFTAVKRAAYVMGWGDGVFVSVFFGAPDHTRAGTPPAALSRCISNMTNVQLDAIFMKWLGEHPER